MAKYVCIHGHFYQPPRENPWLETVEVQDSAAPYHDWNQRITAECYAPNAVARINGPQGTIARIVNNYRHISFNFGPTLLWWLAQEDPALVQTLKEADQDSAKRLGHGNAMAQVYNHLIMPLANRRDKTTQIRWGAVDFEHHFGRKPEGMWLAETAVDLQSLELMAADGLRFVVLAPSQAAAIRGPEDTAWHDVSGGDVPTHRAYRVSLPSGKTMAVFFYNGELSRAVAFDNLLDSGERFSARVRGAFDGDNHEDQLMSIATDGESYGHHHRFGEMALAYVLADLDDDPDIELTNYGAFLADHPPKWTAKLRSNSSWSCPHGVERWQSDCGCALNPGSGWSQAWRGPLREAVDHLGLAVNEQFEDLGGKLFHDPWAARDDYIHLLLDQSAEAREAFFARQAKGELNAQDQLQALKLLECQRWTLYSYTSCAWFFDDISGIEAVQNLRFAARALQLAEELGAQGKREEFIATLAKAKSNLPRKGDGAKVWQRSVEPRQMGPRRVAGHAAISGVLDDSPPPTRLHCYQIKSLQHQHLENLGLDFAWGRLKVSHVRLSQNLELDYAALHYGDIDFKAWVTESHGESADPGQEAAELFKRLDPLALSRHLDITLEGPHYTLGDLFLDGRRDLARRVLGRTMASQAATARDMYESNRELMRLLTSINVPLPGIYRALAEAMIVEDLINGLAADPGGPVPPRLGELVVEARALDLSLHSAHLLRAIEQALARDLDLLVHARDDTTAAQHALSVLGLAEALEMEPNLWQAQNLFSKLLVQSKELGPVLWDLGRKLNFSEPEQSE